MEFKSARQGRWPHYYAALISLFLFTAFTPPVTAKKATLSNADRVRIMKIEKDFAVHFFDLVEFAMKQGPNQTYWKFIAIAPKAMNFSRGGFPFAVRQMANDQEVIDAIASAMCAADFYEMSIKEHESATPTPSPTPAGYKIEARRPNWDGD